MRRRNPSPSHTAHGPLPLPPGEVFRASIPSPVGRRRGPLAEGQWEDEGVRPIEIEPLLGLLP
jgi:hypothetical protein